MIFCLIIFRTFRPTVLKISDFLLTIHLDPSYPNKRCCGVHCCRDNRLFRTGPIYLPLFSGKCKTNYTVRHWVIWRNLPLVNFWWYQNSKSLPFYNRLTWANCRWHKAKENQDYMGNKPNHNLRSHTPSDSFILKYCRVLPYTVCRVYSIGNMYIYVKLALNNIQQRHQTIPANMLSFPICYNHVTALLLLAYAHRGIVNVSTITMTIHAQPPW